MTAVKSLLFDSFGKAPDAWHALCQSDDLAMDAKVLEVFQRTLADQCRVWGLILSDESGKTVGCSALCMFNTEMIESGNTTVIAMRDYLRRLWPGMGKMKVLFCGLPVPSGSTHLRLAPGVPADTIVAEVERVMHTLAQETGCRLLVFKELYDASGSLAASLSARGFLKGRIPPMHLLNTMFEDFDAYSNSLKSRYRSQVQRSRKKLEAAGFEIVCGRGAAFFIEHFDAHTHNLYVAVQSRAEQKLELMPQSFFVELAKVLGNEALLTLIRRGGKICAFTFSITRAHTHYNMYSGLDYERNEEGDLYFNLFYADMDQAFRAGATCLHLGQTSDLFKSRLGTTTQKLWFFAKAPSPMLHRILKVFAPLAFPKVAEVEKNDVFSTPPPSPKNIKH